MAERITISPVKATNGEELIRILSSYREWLKTYLGEINEIEAIGAEINKYRAFGQPNDRYHIAWNNDGRAKGCISIAFTNKVATVSRFHVPKPGEGVGRQMLEYAIRYAIDEHAKRIELDTSDQMLSAKHLYASVGFEDVTRHQSNPEPEVTYFAKSLL